MENEKHRQSEREQSIAENISAKKNDVNSVLVMPESTKRMLKSFQSIMPIHNINTTLMTEAFEKRITAFIPEMVQTKNLSDSLKKAFAFSTKYNYGSFLEVARRMTEVISKSIQQIKLPTISEEQKQELIKIHKLWGSYGWTINPCVSTKSLFDYKSVEKKDADSIALKQCSQHKMEQIFGVISETKRVKKSDFEEAMFDFKNKKYKSCVLVLFAMIDAIMIRLQKKKSATGKNRRRVGIGAVKEAKKRTEAEVNTEFFLNAIFCINLFACLEKMFEDGNDFKKQPDVINRNFVDHGMMTRTVRRKDCIQLFLLYYNILKLLDLIY